MLFSIGVCANEDMRGVWVSTVYNLDFPLSQTTDSNKLKKEIDTIVANCKEVGYNAIFLQVRPSADAIYPSKLFTWSRYLTGASGVCPDNNFDPLSYWIDKCHQNSIELHAWINPYRVTKNGDDELSKLPCNHIAIQNPDWLVKYTDGNYYLNPGIPEVRELVVAGVKEILEDYDVDGIHMDDYFYPGRDFVDEQTYALYNGRFSNIADWRRNNVNLLVKELHELSNSYGKVFGISPSGIWDNKKSNPLGSDTNGKSSYSELFADSRLWVTNGYVDYIAPQIYWEFGFSAADYGVLAKWWENVCEDTDVKLYIGLASYRAYDAKESSAWYGGVETLRQMEYNRQSRIIDGEIHFRYKLVNDTPLVRNAIKSIYAPDTIKVVICGTTLVSDTPPVVQNNRTLLPMRAVFESLGTTVSWDNDTQTAIAQKDDKVLLISIGDNFFTIDGIQKELDVPACIIGERTYVPVRAVSESFGFDVLWDGDNNSVIIND